MVFRRDAAPEGRGWWERQAADAGGLGGVALEIQVERHPEFLLFRISGDLRLWNHSDREDKLVASFRSALEEPPTEVILSLLGVHHVDSRGIGALVRIPIECSKRRIALKVVLPAGVPGSALRRVKIFDFWPELPAEPGKDGSEPA